MEEQSYYDISFQTSAKGPMGIARRPDMDAVIQWLREREGRLHLVMILKMPGEMPDLPDKESIT